MLSSLLNLLRRPSDSACRLVSHRPASYSSWQRIGNPAEAAIPPHGEESAEQPDWQAIDSLFASAGSRADWRSAMQG